jgi:hypothetical protein
MRSVTLLLGILVLIQCKTSQVQEEGRLILEMKRTACLGTCPDYEIKVYSNGTVIYQGNRHVPHVGEQEIKLSDKDLQKIQREMKSIDFFSLEDKYYEDVTDLPTTYLTIYKEDLAKTIMDYYGAPTVLREFEENIQEIIFRYLERD